MEVYRKFLHIVVVVFAVLLVFVIFANVWIIGSTRDQILDNEVDDLESRTALLLGTSYNTVD